jgi:hypothetical protein
MFNIKYYNDHPVSYYNKIISSNKRIKTLEYEIINYKKALNLLKEENNIYLKQIYLLEDIIKNKIEEKNKEKEEKVEEEIEKKEEKTQESDDKIDIKITDDNNSYIESLHDLYNDNSFKIDNFFSFDNNIDYGATSWDKIDI